MKMERSLPKLMVDYAARMNSCWMSVYDSLDLQVRFGKTRQVLNLRLNVKAQRMNVPLLACLSVSLKVGVMMPECVHSPLLSQPCSTLSSIIPAAGSAGRPCYMMLTLTL